LNEAAGICPALGNVVWPLVARAQQATMAVIGLLGSDSPELYMDRLRAFNQRSTGTQPA
jgi:hypothetical protein